MTAVASAIPAMYSALVGLCRAAAATDLAGVTIVQGPPTLIPAGADQVLVLGASWDPEEAESAVSEFSPYSNFAQLETIEIPGAVMVKAGDAAAASPPMLRAFAILGVLKGLLLADPTLGGAVGYSADSSGGGPAETDSLAHLSGVGWQQAVSSGARTVVTFTVGAQAVIPD